MTSGLSVTIPMITPINARIVTIVLIRVAYLVGLAISHPCSILDVNFTLFE